MIIYGLILPGFILVVVGLLIAGFQVWPGWFSHRAWYRHLPKFFISTGIMLPVSAHLWIDGAVLFVVWLIWDMISHRQKTKDEVEAFSE